jgi:uncharacterized protein YdiU (UPF0061 family)
MSKSSQINQLSKRQILESLMYEQNQSSVTLSRLITAVARTSGLDPVKLADMFTDDKGNQDFVETFNNAVKAKHAAKQATAMESAKPAPQTDDADSTDETDSVE